MYAFSAQDLAATETVPLCRYRNKVMLVTNVASKCGNTPQYGPLQALYEKHRDAGFFVLGFPCNQFGGQEPGDAVEITACTTKYGVSFPMFEKITVNTDSTFGAEHPLYAWLKAQPGGAGKIEWNFAKFLIGRDGKLIKRYSASFLNGAASEQAQLDADIAAALPSELAPRARDPRTSHRPAAFRASGRGVRLCGEWRGRRRPARSPRRPRLQHRSQGSCRPG
ncbi:MAG: glutathione peroxidase [Myxococcales bacterium]|nr:glutathione peroxidase [Myxococcales bacterium]